MIVGLVGLVLSFILPIVVIMALISGPAETWDRISAWIPGQGSEPEVCEGYADWSRDMQDRFSEWQSELDEYGALTQWSNAETKAVISKTHVLLSYMENSAPPEEAHKLMTMYVDLLSLTVTLAEAHLEGDNSTLLRERGKLEPKLEEIMIEHDRVVTVCE